MVPDQGRSPRHRCAALSGIILQGIVLSFVVVRRIRRVITGANRDICVLIIDSQVHAYERNHPGRPWHGALPGPAEVTGSDMVAAMDQVGVDGALLVSPFAMYRHDAGYAIEVHRQHPGRFGLIKPVDPTDPAVAEIISDWASLDGTVGVRIMMTHGASIDPADPGVATVLDAASRQGLPVNILCWGLLKEIGPLARRHADTMIVIDHLGMRQALEPPVPERPFDALPELLALAEHDNIAVKISGACTLSHQPFPYDDIWAPLRQIFDTFGIDRCLWGTDWTRATDFLTYGQGVDAFRQSSTLTESERTLLMGGSLQRIYGWAPSKP